MFDSLRELELAPPWDRRRLADIHQDSGPKARPSRGTSGFGLRAFAIPLRERPKPSAADVLGHAAERVVADPARRERFLEQQPEREPFRVHPPTLEEGLDLAYEPDRLGLTPASGLDFGEVDGASGNPPDLLPQRIGGPLQQRARGPDRDRRATRRGVLPATGG